MASEREFDLLVYGASGYTGIHVTEYLATVYPPSMGLLKWAIAGRNLKKLQMVKDRLERLTGESWPQDLPVVVIDASYPELIDQNIKRAKVCISLVGPYAKMGEVIVRSCAENRTHYVDITGEPQFVRKMIWKYDQMAKDNGVWIVPSCGFDSVPSDLSAYMMVDFADKELDESLVNMQVCLVSNKMNNRLQKDSGVTPGGGTLASAIGLLEGGDEAWKVLIDPYGLVDKKQVKHHSKAVDKERFLPQLLPSYNKDLPGSKKWTTHFPMAMVNEKTVRRSGILMSDKYGKQFSYREALAVSNPLSALLLSIGFIFVYLFLMLPFGPGLAKRLIPAQSQVPPEKTKDYKPGKMVWKGAARTDSGQVVISELRGVDDGGYTETAKMVVESALCLFQDLEKVRKASGYEGGVLTPACLGDTLVDRLRRRQMTLKVSLE